MQPHLVTSLTTSPAQGTTHTNARGPIADNYETLRSNESIFNIA